MVKMAFRTTWHTDATPVESNDSTESNSIFIINDEAEHLTIGCDLILAMNAADYKNPAEIDTIKNMFNELLSQNISPATDDGKYSSNEAGEAMCVFVKKGEDYDGGMYTDFDRYQFDWVSDTTVETKRSVYASTRDVNIEPWKTKHLGGDIADTCSALSCLVGQFFYKQYKGDSNIGDIPTVNIKAALNTCNVLDVIEDFEDNLSVNIDNYLDGIGEWSELFSELTQLQKNTGNANLLNDLFVKCEIEDGNEEKLMVGLLFLTEDESIEALKYTVGEYNGDGNVF